MKWLKNEIREEIKKFLDTNKKEFTTIQNLRETAKAFLRGKFTVIQAYPKKYRNTSNKQPNCTPTGTTGTTTKTAQSK